MRSRCWCSRLGVFFALGRPFRACASSARRVRHAGWVRPRGDRRSCRAARAKAPRPYDGQRPTLAGASRVTTSRAGRACRPPATETRPRPARPPARAGPRPRRTGSRAGRRGRPRATCGRDRLEAGGGREPFERPDEHCELEVGLRHAVREATDTPAMRSTGSHSTTSPAPGSPYQGRPSAASLSSSSRKRSSGAADLRAPSRPARRHGAAPPGAGRACTAEAHRVPTPSSRRQNASAATSHARRERTRRVRGRLGDAVRADDARPGHR